MRRHVSRLYKGMRYKREGERGSGRELAAANYRSLINPINRELHKKSVIALKRVSPGSITLYNEIKHTSGTRIKFNVSSIAPRVYSLRLINRRSDVLSRRETSAEALNPEYEQRYEIGALSNAGEISHLG